MAKVPGLGGKPIESVENACASGGQAVLSVAHKLLLGLGEVGIAVGYEKMRDDEGKIDGKLIGKVLGYFSHPDERVGKVYVFPHIFAEVMPTTWRPTAPARRTWPPSRSRSTPTASTTPSPRCRIQMTLDKATTIEGRNRYIVDGLPLKTYDCSQISDGYAALVLATEEGLRRLGWPRRTASSSPATARPPTRCRRGPRRAAAAGAFRAMNSAYEMAGSAGRRRRRRGPRLLLGHGRDRRRGARQGAVRPGRELLGRRKAARTASAASTPRAA